MRNGTAAAATSPRMPPKTRPRRGKKRQRSLVYRVLHHRADIAAHVIVLGVVLISLLPYFWMVSSSLRTMPNMFRVPIQWIPDPINWRSYVLAWQAQDFTRYFLNSGVVAVAITLGNLLLCSFAGYSLAKFRYFGRGLLFILILSTMMLPLEVTMVPLFLIIKRLDWANSYQGLIVPFLVDGFGVFLMRQYMLGIPKDLIDSARIDGASELRIFWQIVLPLCKPALVALGVFTFREAWDMYIWPLIIVSKDSLRTLPLAISLFMSSYGTAWDQLMAIAVLGTLPMILLFFFLQRAFIQGIAVTGLKE
jgi:multiple sugar transport system permease protein